MAPFASPSRCLLDARLKDQGSVMHIVLYATDKTCILVFETILVLQLLEKDRDLPPIWGSCGVQLEGLARRRRCGRIQIVSARASCAWQDMLQRARHPSLRPDTSRRGRSKQALNW